MLIEKLTELSDEDEPCCLPGDPAKFCAKWYAVFKERGNVQDGPRSGRHSKVPEFIVVGAVHMVCEELVLWRQADLKDHPFFSYIRETYDVTLRTLWRRMQRYERRLGKTRSCEFKSVLKPDVVEDRIKQTERWLRLGVKAAAFAGGRRRAGVVEAAPGVRIPRTVPELNMDWLDRIIWIDSKKFYIQPHNVKAWGLRGAPSIVLSDSRVRSPMVIHYYAAVNSKHGAILIRAVSGTRGKGYSPDKQYKVGVCRRVVHTRRNPCRGGPYCPCKHARPHHCVQVVQAHHMVTLRHRRCLLPPIHQRLFVNAHTMVVGPSSGVLLAIYLHQHAALP
jgi:hypothetical protein